MKLTKGQESHLREIHWLARSCFPATDAIRLTIYKDRIEADLKTEVQMTMSEPVYHEDDKQYSGLLTEE